MNYNLSIIIPVYNVERYIISCLESVKYSIGNRTDVEVIVVDDGSPDHSIDKAQPILNVMPSARLIRQKNQGLSGARNTGLNAAKGEYVWFVDSDDTLLPNAIEDVTEAILKYSGIDVFASVLLQKHETTGKVSVEYTPNRNVSTGKDYMFSGNQCGASQRFIIRRDFLNGNGLLFKMGVYHEDGDFGNRMLYLANRIVILSEPVYCYLLRSSGSIMSSRKMKMNYDLIEIFKGLEVFCDEKVLKDDIWKYKAQIFSCLSCTIMFSRNEIETQEFMTFYKEYKDLIHKKAGELLLHMNQLNLKQIKCALHFYFFPLFYTRLKHRVRLILGMKSSN